MYDDQKNIVKTIYPHGSIVLDKFNSKNQVIETNFNNTTIPTTYKYDGQRNLVEKSSAMGTQTWKYDQRGNLVNVVFPSGHSYSYVYTFHNTGSLATVTENGEQILSIPEFL